MTASRLVLLATTTAALLAALAGCIGATSPVTAVSQRGAGDLFPWSEPGAALGTIEGELRRGSQPPPDEAVLDMTTPWPDVSVEFFDASGQRVAAVGSDSQGLFRVTLPPGEYLVKPLWPATRLYPGAPKPPTSAVTVIPDAIVSVWLYYNPGIF
jgi:hypothetical protein